LKIELALHSSRRKKVIVGKKKTQIGEVLQSREAQTQVSISSFFDYDNLLQLFFYVIAKVYLEILQSCIILQSHEIRKRV